MQRFTISLFLQDALHVSDGFSVHHMELKTAHTVSDQYCYSCIISLFIFMKSEAWLWLSRAVETCSGLDCCNKVLRTDGLSYCYELRKDAEESGHDVIWVIYTDIFLKKLNKSKKPVQYSRCPYERLERDTFRLQVSRLTVWPTDRHALHFSWVIHIFSRLSFLFLTILSLLFLSSCLCARAGQLQRTWGPHNSLRTRLMAAFLCTYIKRVWGAEFNRRQLLADCKLH